MHLRGHQSAWGTLMDKGKRNRYKTKSKHIQLYDITLTTLTKKETKKINPTYGRPLLLRFERFGIENPYCPSFKKTHLTFTT